MEECSICYENMNMNKWNNHIKVGHTFHKSCISKIINKVCPLCKNQ